jgi:hypothetical protein
MRKTLFFTLFLLFVACDDIKPKEPTDTFKNEITYLKDSRTGLCFVRVYYETYDRNDMGSRDIFCVSCDSLENVKFVEFKR